MVSHFHIHHSFCSNLSQNSTGKPSKSATAQGLAKSLSTAISKAPTSNHIGTPTLLHALTLALVSPLIPITAKYTNEDL